VGRAFVLIGAKINHRLLRLLDRIIVHQEDGFKRLFGELIHRKPAQPMAFGLSRIQINAS
jgi:hypothetical protein